MKQQLNIEAFLPLSIWRGAGHEGLLRRVRLLALLICISATIVNAQSIITDRPDQTESSFIVPDDHWQFELGVLRTATDYGWGFNNIEWGIPSSLIRYGVNDFFELRLASEIGFVPHFQDEFPLGLTANEVGFKVKLADEKNCIPQMAFIFHIPLHWFVSEYSSNAPNARLTFSHQLSDRISLGYNIGMEWLEYHYGFTTQVFPNYIFTLTSGFSLTEKLSAFIETFGTFTGFNGEQHFTNFDGGFTYLIRDNMQLDLSGGWGFFDYRYRNEHWQNYFLSLGFSFRLPN